MKNITPLTLLRRTGILLLPILLLILAGCASTSANANTPSATPTPSVLTTLNGPFTATVLEGSDKGTAITGNLELQLSSKGDLSGNLTETSGQKVSVTGQVKGQLIGLFFNIDSGKKLFGTGVIGYDPSTKKNFIGGTFSGPSETESGVWRYVEGDGIGGCTTGIPDPHRYGLCYVID